MSNELIFIFQLLTIVSAIAISSFLGCAILIGTILMQSVLANLFILKQINLFGLEVTATDAYAVGAMLGLNLLRELYGKKLVKKTIGFLFGALIFYVICCYIHLAFIPSVNDYMHGNYCALLEITPRLLFASLCSFFLSQVLDYFLYGFLRTYYKNYLLMANYGSLLISQFFDTLLFSYLALGGIVSSVGEIIFFSYSIKIFVILTITPLTWLIIKGIMLIKPIDNF